jgi:radical SAM superfamily enzyme YgiQ (UPF0313 family)
MGDAMAVTEKSIDAMARAGCIGMKFGVEAPIPRSSRSFVSRSRSTRSARSSTGAPRGESRPTRRSFGLEADTPETMQRTLDFCCSLPVDSIQFSTTTPFPGTEHHRNAKAAGT